MPEPETVIAAVIETYPDYLMALADEIGNKIDRGELPPMDENGFYIL